LQEDLLESKAVSLRFACCRDGDLDREGRRRGDHLYGFREVAVVVLAVVQLPQARCPPERALWTVRGEELIGASRFMRGIRGAGREVAGGDDDDLASCACSGLAGRESLEGLVGS